MSNLHNKVKGCLVIALKIIHTKEVQTKIRNGRTSSTGDIL